VIIFQAELEVAVRSIRTKELPLLVEYNVLDPAHFSGRKLEAGVKSIQKSKLPISGRGCVC
jgi:hypothetical protein